MRVPPSSLLRFMICLSSVFEVTQELEKRVSANANVWCPQASLVALRKEVREAKIAQGKGARLPVVCRLGTGKAFVHEAARRSSEYGASCARPPGRIHASCLFPACRLDRH